MNINDELRMRFIEDYGLPISVFYDPWFTEMINIMENYYGSKTKFENLVNEIGPNKTPGQFISQCREIRHEISDWIEHNQAYLEFHGDKDIEKHYKVTSQYPKRNIYSGNNVGKRFISLDLREANFQSLRFHDPAIVRDCITWDEFVGKWTDSNYLKKTKLNRQRLLGKVSPEKQMIIETYIMSGLHEMFMMKQTSLDLISLKTDELIYEVRSSETNLEKALSDAYWIASHDLGVRVKAETFILRDIQLFTRHGNSIYGFYKEYDDDRISFHGIPKIYLPQFIKYHEGKTVNELDLAFLTPQDNELARFMYPLKDRV